MLLNVSAVILSLCFITPTTTVINGCLSVALLCCSGAVWWLFRGESVIVRNTSFYRILKHNHTYCLTKYYYIIVYILIMAYTAAISLLAGKTIPLFITLILTSALFILLMAKVQPYQ